MLSTDKRILVATNYSDKLREIRQILSGTGWEVVGLNELPAYPEPIEDGETLAENALIKAREGFRQSGIMTLADDTGLEVDALDGRPGVYSARYAGENATYTDNVNLLIREMSGVPEPMRTARFRTVMALVGNDSEECWEGVAEGRIISESIGSDGFGYDPVFYSPELGQTFAETSLKAKNRVSHRGRALQKLVERLKSL